MVTFPIDKKLRAWMEKLRCNGWGRDMAYSIRAWTLSQFGGTNSFTVREYTVFSLDSYKNISR